jgi:ribonuclease E
MKDNTGKIIAKLPIDVATFLLNEKRNEISEFEAQHNVQVVLVPSPNLDSPHYDIQRLKTSDLGNYQGEISSYAHAEQKQDPEIPTTASTAPATSQEPIIKTSTPAAPKPPAEAAKSGFIGRIFGSIFGAEEKDKIEKQAVITYTAPTVSTTKLEESTTKTTSPRDNRGRQNKNRDTDRKGGDGKRRQSNRNRNRNARQDSQNKERDKHETKETKETKDKRESKDNRPKRQGQRNRNPRNQKQDTKKTESTGLANQNEETPVNTMPIAIEQKNR